MSFTSWLGESPTSRKEREKWVLGNSGGGLFELAAYSVARLTGLSSPGHLAVDLRKPPQRGVRVPLLHEALS
jgi:hypothetical protein